MRVRVSALDFERQANSATKILYSLLVFTPVFVQAGCQKWGSRCHGGSSRGTALPASECQQDLGSDYTLPAAEDTWEAVILLCHRI